MKSAPCLLFGLLCVLVAGCQQPDTLTSLSFDTSLLQEGDLILRRGRSVSSRAVERADNQYNTYSHIGILVCEDSCWFVIHCVPGEAAETGGEEVIKCDSLSLFLRSDRAEAGAVFRYDTLAEARTNIAADARRLFQRRVPFDRNYLCSDSTKLYCTEMVDLLYRHAGIELTEGRRHSPPAFREPVIYPSDITKNCKLSEIIAF
ncbi:MAG: hypothetical protein J5719_01810 [Bacteroidales bacterium]|nr:hypothetical protein [Bacteroidales bacterium]